MRLLNVFMNICCGLTLSLADAAPVLPPKPPESNDLAVQTFWRLESLAKMLAEWDSGSDTYLFKSAPEDAPSLARVVPHAEALYAQMSDDYQAILNDPEYKNGIEVLQARFWADALYTKFHHLLNTYAKALSQLRTQLKPATAMDVSFSAKILASLERRLRRQVESVQSFAERTNDLIERLIRYRAQRARGEEPYDLVSPRMLLDLQRIEMAGWIEETQLEIDQILRRLKRPIDFKGSKLDMARALGQGFRSTFTLIASIRDGGASDLPLDGYVFEDPRPALADLIDENKEHRHGLSRTIGGPINADNVTTIYELALSVQYLSAMARLVDHTMLAAEPERPRSSWPKLTALITPFQRFSRSQPPAVAEPTATELWKVFFASAGIDLTRSCGGSQGLMALGIGSQSE